MQISSRLTIAVHIITLIGVNPQSEKKLTSDMIAGSVGVNPVIIRKTLSQLKKAGIIDVARGTGGVSFTKSLAEVTLFDIYQAVDSLGKTGQLFAFHERPNQACPIGHNIHSVLDDKLAAAQSALEHELAQTTLAQIVQEAQEKITSEQAI